MSRRMLLRCASVQSSCAPAYPSIAPFIIRNAPPSITDTGTEWRRLEANPATSTATTHRPPGSRLSALPSAARRIGRYRKHTSTSASSLRAIVSIPVMWTSVDEASTAKQAATNAARGVARNTKSATMQAAAITSTPKVEPTGVTLTR